MLTSSNSCEPQPPHLVSAIFLSTRSVLNDCVGFAVKGIFMQLETLVLIENRLHQNSTQIYLEHIKVDVLEFFVPVGDFQKPIGYLKFKNAAKKHCFELSSLESLDYPNPYPQFSLTGVLYSRQAALEAHSVISAYQQEIDQIDPPLTVE